MDIDWMALVKVALVSFAFGVGLVTVFSLGILGTAADATEGAGASSGGSQQPSGVSSRTLSRSTGRLVAVVCFAACGAAVLFGLWLIVPQFH